MKFSETEEDDPEIPSDWDWYVYGTIKGPACPGDELPELPSFLGTVMPQETEALNRLLSYSGPIQDRFHLGKSERSYSLTVHYDAAIDPASFAVEPNNAKLRSLFHPQPDTTETVTIPVTPGKNKLKLSASGRRLPKDDNGVNKDIDFFEARVDK